MISTTWIAAPAGVSGSGSLVVRPVAVPAERPMTARLRTLPMTAVPRVLGTSGCGIVPAFDLVPTGRGDDARTPDALGATFGPKHIQQNTGTTLGIHPSRRPLS
ncbi:MULTISPECIES: hypothetical protein [unclassified Geodermatophilus]|uniref:hypothetical protein n=1 Tax=unclassified Geodermatophilus TaxID=2637632 RepID=UPI003EE9FBF3